MRADLGLVIRDTKDAKVLADILSRAGYAPYVQKKIDARIVWIDGDAKTEFFMEPKWEPSKEGER